MNSDCGLSLRRLSCSFADLVIRCISAEKHAFLKSQNGFTSSRKRFIKRLFVISSVIFQICSFYT